jgi:hypothetical protein
VDLSSLRVEIRIEPYAIYRVQHVAPHWERSRRDGPEC